MAQAISFVGSTAVGTHVYRLGSEHGKRVQSMMGAKNHAVVLPDASKEQTLNALAGAGFGAAGQRCMATSVLVLVGDTAKWIPELVEKAKTLAIWLFALPNTRSPSQWPGIARSFAVAGRSLIDTASQILPRSSVFAV